MTTEIQTHYSHVQFRPQVKGWQCINKSGAWIGFVTYEARRMKWVFAGSQATTYTAEQLRDVIQFMDQLT